MIWLNVLVALVSLYWIGHGTCLLLWGLWHAARNVLWPDDRLPEEPRRYWRAGCGED